MKILKNCLLLPAAIAFASPAIAQLPHQCAQVCTTNPPAVPLPVSLVNTDYPGGSWTSSAPSIAAITPSGVVTGMAAGVATLTYAYTPACGTALTKNYYAYVNVVAPGAGTISGPSTVCSGFPSTIYPFTSTISGGLWSSAYGYVNIDPGTGNLTGASIGTDIVTYTAVNACGTSYTTQAVTATGKIGDIYTIAGDGTRLISGDHRQGIIASAPNLRAVSVDDATGDIYICDITNMCVKRITASGVMSIVAGNNIAGTCGDGGPATAASLDFPRDCTVGGGMLYICCSGSHNIRVVDLSTGVINEFAGMSGSSGFSDNSIGVHAQFYFPNSLRYDAVNNCLWVMDMGNNAVRTISLSGTNAVATICTNSTWANDARDVVYDNNRNCLYVTDNSNNMIEQYNLWTSGPWFPIAGGAIPSPFPNGDGGDGIAADLNAPVRMALDGNHLYFTDQLNHRARFIDLSSPTYKIYALAGDGTIAPFGADGDCNVALSAQFSNAPIGIAAGSAGNVYIADANNNEVREMFVKGNISISGPTDACSYAGTFTTILSGYPGTYTLQWLVNGGPIVGATGPTYTGSFSPGDIVSCAVIITPSSSCDLNYQLISNQIVQSCPAPPPSPSGLHSHVATDTRFQAMPNPSQGTLAISGSQGNSSNDQATIEITDMTGKILLSTQVNFVNGSFTKTVTLDKSIANGVYLVKIKNSDTDQTIRFTLER